MLRASLCAGTRMETFIGERSSTSTSKRGSRANYAGSVPEDAIQKADRSSRRRGDACLPEEKDVRRLRGAPRAGGDRERGDDHPERGADVDERLVLRRDAQDDDDAADDEE